MSTPVSQTVSAEVGVRLVVSRQASVPLAASLHYTTADPYAVRAAFHVGLDEPVEWVFARDLLADGAGQPAGDGDVMIWPAGDDGQVLAIALSSPSGDALFEAGAADVSAFLARTYDLVPQGAEPGYVDVDAGIASLLAEGGPW